MAAARLDRINPVRWSDDQPGSGSTCSQRWYVHRHGVTPRRRRSRRVRCRRLRGPIPTYTVVVYGAGRRDRRDRLVRASIVCSAHNCRSCLARRFRHAGARWHRLPRDGQHACATNFTYPQSTSRSRWIRSRTRAGRRWCRAAATHHRTFMASVHRRTGSPRRSRFGVCRCSR